MRCGLCLWGRGVQTFQLVMIPRFHGAGVLFLFAPEAGPSLRLVRFRLVSLSSLHCMSTVRVIVWSIPH